MSKKLLAICLAAIGFGGLLTPGVSAREASTPAATTRAAASLPTVARINQTVVVETGGIHRRHWHNRHHRYHGHHYYHHRYHHYRHHHHYR